MIENSKEKHESFSDFDSELLLKILNKTSIEINNIENKELFADENWKSNTKKNKKNNKLPSDNSNLKRILSEIFSDKEILIQDNNDGSQTIFLS